MMPGEESWGRLVALHDKLLNSTAKFSSETPDARPTTPDLPSDQLRSTEVFSENPCPPSDTPDPAPSYLDIDIDTKSHSSPNTVVKCQEPDCAKCPLKGKTRVWGVGR